MEFVRLKTIADVFPFSAEKLQAFKAGEVTAEELATMKDFMGSFPLPCLLPAENEKLISHFLEFYVPLFESVSSLKAPVRGTKYSAGYDLFLPFDIHVAPGKTEMVTYPLFYVSSGNLRAEVVARSSIFKNTGLVSPGFKAVLSDKELFYQVVRNMTSKEVVVPAGTRIGQVIFVENGTLETQEVFHVVEGGQVIHPIYNPFPEHEYVLGYTEDAEIPPYTMRKFSIGLAAKMQENNYMTISMLDETPYNQAVLLVNGEGTIDSDYYGNESNGGEIFMQLYNDSPSSVFIPKSTPLFKAKVRRYHILDNDTHLGERIGGFGSTGGK